MVPLSIFLGIPKTDRQDTIQLRIRYQESFIRKSGLLLRVARTLAFPNLVVTSTRKPRMASLDDSPLVFASENFDWTPGAQYIRVLCECVSVPTTPNLQGGVRVGWR